MVFQKLGATAENTQYLDGALNFDKKMVSKKQSVGGNNFSSRHRGNQEQIKCILGTRLGPSIERNQGIKLIDTSDEEVLRMQELDQQISQRMKLIEICSHGQPEVHGSAYLVTGRKANHLQGSSVAV